MQDIRATGYDAHQDNITNREYDKAATVTSNILELLINL
jgi:hypothetical protein